jgi:hypothetical protein
MDRLKTKAEQRIERLINLGRPLTQAESGELYRALHADYMRKWRKAKAEAAERSAGRFAVSERRRLEKLTLKRAMREMVE